MKNTVLGKSVEYKDQYDSSLLYPIERKSYKDSYGFDIWNCYEFSWLNSDGKPEVRILRFIVQSKSKWIVESKSVKLYLNSFNNTRYENAEKVLSTIENDLSNAVRENVMVELHNVNSKLYDINPFEGVNLDNLDIICDTYNPDWRIIELVHGGKEVQESIFTDLFRSNCPVTNQPDFASIQIFYKGKAINHNALLKYLVSFRNHTGFHESCIESIFDDIILACGPKELILYGRYTRRGGIDINPVRSTHPLDVANFQNLRLTRQ